MQEQEFIAGSRQVWERLESTLAHLRGRGVAEMPGPELRALHEDYRRAAADLAFAQTHFPASQTHAFLNDLVGVAHTELYGSAPRKLTSLWRFMRTGYPRLVRAHAREVALASALLLGAMALGLLLSYVNYPLARVFIPEQLRDGVGDRIEQGADATGISSAIAPLLAAGITANNIQVALMAFAGGMTLGALTVYSMIQNGLLLGTLAGVFAKGGATLFFWSLILPHGSLELPAIILAGASGLSLAKALISPGDLPRAASLRAASPDAVRLALGTIPLFLIAGAIEGFFTPSQVDPLLKLAFGLLMTALLLGYLVFAGRTPVTDVRAP
ncbi:MAG: stage II sporulation protein M [Actinobacteria bacterium]|nr:stage II sporulation protein M [Actinomycetota bacterium]MCG2807804.1 stage II sporulation protein M [Coriobacteriia bacterium]